MALKVFSLCVAVVQAISVNPPRQQQMLHNPCLKHVIPLLMARVYETKN